MAKSKKTAKPAVGKTIRKIPAKKASTPAKKAAADRGISLSPVSRRTNTIYYDSSVFFPVDSADGYYDHFQDGRYTKTPGGTLRAALLLPVGAVMKRLSIHYMNTTAGTPGPNAFFLREHIDHHTFSGEIEVSFITCPPMVSPPDNYVTVTVTSFPDGGEIKDKYLYYVDLLGTGDFGGGSKLTIRGYSITYEY